MYSLPSPKLSLWPEKGLSIPTQQMKEKPYLRQVSPRVHPTLKSHVETNNLRSGSSEDA